jgi:hypothetical protein
VVVWDLLNTFFDIVKAHKNNDPGEAWEKGGLGTGEHPLLPV